MTAAQCKEFKSLNKENLRDRMTNLERETGRKVVTAEKFKKQIAYAQKTEALPVADDPSVF